MSNADVGIYRTAFQTYISCYIHDNGISILFSIQRSVPGEHRNRWPKLRILWRELLPIPFFWQYPPVLADGYWESVSFFIYMGVFCCRFIRLFFLLLVQVVNVFMYLGTMSLNALNRPKDAFWITLIAAIANILLDIILIPVLGITGAAVATLIAMT